MRRKQKTDFYFASFSKAIEFSRQEALMLYDVLQGFQPENLPKVMEEMHKLENSADISKHEMMEKLAQEFITPIERDDIAQLAQELDEITDHIEDIILRMYMFNIQCIREEAFDFAKVIIGCCEQLKTALADFNNYKKSKIIPQAIIEINSLENEGDKLYTKALRSLFTTCKDPIEVLAWTETFRHMERCCDACEHAANVIESIVMNNS